MTTTPEATAAQVRTASDDAARRAWVGSRRRVFLDSHTPDWADPHQRGPGVDEGTELLTADPRAVMDTIADAGADSVIVFAKCQYGNSYYPSRVGRVHSGLRGRDVFGESLAAAHDRGMKVIAYFSNMWDTAVAGEQPGWRMETLGGRPSTARWPALCLLSPYRQRALEHVREIAERYPVDGLWSDILTVGPCACHRCRDLFTGRYDIPMPQSPQDPGWLELVRFSNDLLTDYLREQRDVLRAARPDAALIPNFYATTFVDAVSGLTMAHLDLADVGSSEGYTDWHGLAFPGFVARYIRAGVHDGPAEVLTGRFVHTWDFTLRSPAQLRYEAFSAVANGVCVTVDDQPYADGGLEPEVYARLAPVFGEIAARDDVLSGTDPLRHAAIYVSQRSRELDSALGRPENPATGEASAQFPPSQPREGLSDLAAALTGTFRALLESHVPVEIVDDRPLSLEGLHRYDVVVLPDVLAVTEEEADHLRRFVHEGGGLVATGPTAVLSTDGASLERSPLAELFGLTQGPESRYSFPYLRPAGPALADVLGPGPLPHYGRIAEVVVDAADVTVLATRVDPVLETSVRSYWHNNQPAPGRDRGVPVIVERTVGRGRVVYSAARLGNNHGRLGHGAYRDLLAALVRRVARRPAPVEVLDGHRNTELVVAVRGEDLVVHLVTGNPVRGMDLFGVRQPATIEDVACIPRLRLRVPAGTRSVTRIGVGGVRTDLPVAGGLVVVTEAADWETLVLVGAAR